MFKNNPYIQLIRLYRRFVPYKKKAIRFMLMQFGGRMMSLVAPYLLGTILIIVQKGGPNMLRSILPYAIATLIVPIIERAFHGPSRVLEEELSFEATRVYKMHLYHMAILLPMGWHTDNHSGEIIDKINKASDALERFSGDIYASFGTFISFIGALGALIALWPMTTLIMLVLFVGIAFIVKWFDVKIVARIKARQKKSHKVNGLLFDYLSNIRTLITLRFLQPTEVALENAIQDQKELFMKHTTRNEWKWFVTDGSINIIVACIVLSYIYIQRTQTGVVVIGVLSMIMQYVERLSSTFYNITYTYSGMMRYSANVSAVEGLERDYKEYMSIKKIYPSLGVWNAIDLQDLRFTYKDQHKKSHTLHDLQMRIALGEKIAVVGESGSGKSTFLTLLRGLYEVDSVSLYVDGKQYDTLHVLVNSTSLIPQEPEIFDDSMRYNITMGAEVSQEDVEKYARVACFHDVVLSLPNAYDTSIKEKGVNLSGGQKQRLALARGLLASQDSEILLLDESTSSVDSVNEKKIYQNIFATFPKKTIIAAIHKLHLLPMFDMIYVFDKGTIVASGTFNQLIAQDGDFARMRKEYTVDMQKDDEDGEDE